MSSMPPPPPPPPPPPGFQPYQPYQQSGIGEVAGFGIRLGSLIVDRILYGLFSGVFLVPAFVLIAGALKNCDRVTDINGAESIECADGQLNAGMLAAGIAVAVLGAIVVFVIYLRALGRTGQTWGRKIVGVRVVDKNTGQPLGTGRAFGRLLLEGLLSGPICWLGYLWMLWDKDRQTWHDKIVNGQVVRV